MSVIDDILGVSVMVKLVLSDCFFHLILQKLFLQLAHMHENRKGFLLCYQFVCRYLQQSLNFSVVKEIKEIHSGTVTSFDFCLIILLLHLLRLLLK